MPAAGHGRGGSYQGAVCWTLPFSIDSPSRQPCLANVGPPACLSRTVTQLVATDGVFSMDGDIAPLDKIVEVINRLVAATCVSVIRRVQADTHSVQSTNAAHGVLLEQP